MQYKIVISQELRQTYVNQIQVCYAWCLDQFGSAVHSKVWRIDHTEPAFWFANQKDAVLFALRWA